MHKTRWGHPAFFVFAIGFLFSFLLLQNLPFTFGDDLDIIETGNQTSWLFLLKQTFNPTTPVWFALRGDINRTSTRVFQTLLFKFLHQFFGLNPNAFWTLQALGFAGVGTLVFFLLFRSTQNKALSISGAFFFFLLPPVYKSISWMSDPELVAEFFMMAAFYIFLLLYPSKRNDSPFVLSRLILLIGTTWLGMKVKETARIAPFVILTFLLVHQNRNFLRWFRENWQHKLLVLSQFALLVTIVPWRRPENLKFDPSLTPRGLHLNPSTLSVLFGNLEKLFLPVLISLAVCFLIARRRSSESTEKSPNPVLLFFGIWASICLAGSMLGFDLKGQIRYLTTVLIPLTLFTFALFRRLVTTLQSFYPRWGKYCVLSLFAFPVIFQIAFAEGRMRIRSKMDEILFMRNYFSGTDIADYLLTKKMVEDRFGAPHATWDALAQFYHGRLPYRPVEFGEIRIKAWDPDQDVRLGRLKRTWKEWGAVYVLSFDNKMDALSPEVQLIWKGTTDNRSLYSFFISQIKKKAYRKIFLYKYFPPMLSPPDGHILRTG